MTSAVTSGGTSDPTVDLLRQFFEAVSFEEGSRPAYPRLRGLFIEARRHRHRRTRARHLHPRRLRRVPAGGRGQRQPDVLEERELDGVTWSFGNVAHRLSRYSKAGRRDGADFTARGMISTQFVRLFRRVADHVHGVGRRAPRDDPSRVGSRLALRPASGRRCGAPDSSGSPAARPSRGRPNAVMVVTSQCAGTANSAARPPVERPELAGPQPERLGLDGHVRDGLAEVVQGELGELPVGALDVAVARGWRRARSPTAPSGRAPGEVADQPGVHRVAAAADEERPRLGVARRRGPARRLEEGPRRPRRRTSCAGSNVVGLQRSASSGCSEATGRSCIPS